MIHLLTTRYILQLVIPVYANRLTRLHYIRGIAKENEVVSRLSTFGTVRRATRSENVLYDIDLWLNDEAVSVKYQSGDTAEFYFEYTESRRKRYGSHIIILKNKPSWFQTGKATLYAIVVEDTLYLIPKTAVLQYFQENRRHLKWRSLGKYTARNVNRPDACLFFVPHSYFGDAICLPMTTTISATSTPLLDT